MNDCVDAATLKACNDACALESTDLIQDFVDCEDAAFFCDARNCLELIGVDPGEAPRSAADQFEIQRCKNACNEVASCSDPSTTSSCLSGCETESISNVEAFSACVRITNDCSENLSCYTTLGL